MISIWVKQSERLPMDTECLDWLYQIILCFSYLSFEEKSKENLSNSPLEA